MSDAPQASEPSGRSPERLTLCARFEPLWMLWIGLRQQGMSNIGDPCTTVVNQLLLIRNFLVECRVWLVWVMI